jgi:hypothetical protein
MQRPTPHTACPSLAHGTVRFMAVAIGLSLLAGCSGNRNESINRDLDSMRNDAGDARVGANDADQPEPSDADQPEPSDADQPSLDAEADAEQTQLDASDGMDASDSAPVVDAAESTDAGMDAAQLDAETDADAPDASDAALLDATDADSSDAGDATLECDAAALGSRIEITRDTANMNPERVTSLRWQNDAGVFTADLVGQSGTACNQSSEIFGHALAWPEGTTPPIVGGLTRSTMTGCGLETTISTAGNNCVGAAQLPVTTTFRFYTDARATQMRIARTFGFSATTPAYTGTTVELAYVPRVKLSLFPSVIYPNEAGNAVTTVAANMCGGGCAVNVGTNVNTSWSGAWFADVNSTTGQALIVLRDPRMTSPVRLVHNWDAFSSSNLAAFGLVQPTGGWKEPLTEVEYLCFADFESWPQAMRDAAQLPTWCVPD